MTDPQLQFLQTQTSQARIQFLTGSIVRVTHAPLGESFPPDRPWLAQVFPEGLKPLERSFTDALSLKADADRGWVHLADSQGGLFEEAGSPVLKGKQAIGMAIRITPGEHFYGWGEWFNAFRRTKGTLHLKAQDAPAFLQGRQTYSALPFFLSSRGYGFLLLNAFPSSWTIDPRRGRMTLQAGGPALDYLVIFGPAPREILRAYTSLAGRPPLLPRWAFGLWGTGYPQESQDRVIAIAAEHRKRGIPLDALILDYHWEEGFHNFKWRRSLFPSPDTLIKNLKENHVRLGLIFTPFVNQRNQPWKKGVLNLAFKDLPRGCEHDDERALPEYNEAKDKGYLAHDRAEWWFGAGGMIDFTNPDAATWWNDRLRPLYARGIAFFKNDDGEYLPPDARSHLGLSGREYHNLYGFFYGKALYEDMLRLDDRRPFIYARSVWLGSQRYPAIFLGDQKPTFTSLRRAMRAGLNMSLAGFSYWTADIFGLDGPTTPETHMRYAQWALMVPIARYFFRPEYIDTTRFPWSHNLQVEANFRQYAHLRYRLLPYFVASAWQAYQSGLPILRPMILEFGFMTSLANVDDQHMLGDALMLCPVVTAGTSQRQVVLPPGVWHDFWSGRSYAGDETVTLAAPLERLPILVRGGSMVPMGPELDYIPDDHQFSSLQLHFWPPYPIKVSLFDEDGHSRAYQGGAYSQTDLILEELNGHLVLTIHPALGEYRGQAEERDLEFVFHRVAKVRAVWISEQPLDRWQVDPFEGCPVIKVRWGIRHQLKIVLEF